MMRIIQKPILYVCAGLLLFIAEENLSAAPQQEKNPIPRNESDWFVSLGAVVMSVPEYEGSDKQDTRGYPYFDIRWRDDVFFSLVMGLGAYVWKGPEMKLGLSIGYAIGRDENEFDTLDGLGDINDGATANILFEWAVNDYSVDARYENQVSGENTGYLFHLGLGYDLQVTPKFTLKPAVNSIYANSGYTDAYFGISQSQAASSGLQVYAPDPGLKSAGLGLTAIYRLSNVWLLQAIADYQRLLGDAADSPLVRDRYQRSLTLVFSHVF